jgi:hypothetical protein
VTLALDAGPGDGGGIGARVQVGFDGRETTHWMLPGSASSSSAPELYLGLGGATAADRITVTWLDGAAREILNVPAGDSVRVSR